MSTAEASVHIAMDNWRRAKTYLPTTIKCCWMMMINLPENDLQTSRGAPCRPRHHKHAFRTVPETRRRGNTRPSIPPQMSTHVRLSGPNVRIRSHHISMDMWVAIASTHRLDHSIPFDKLDDMVQSQSLRRFIQEVEICSVDVRKFCPIGV